MRAGTIAAVLLALGLPLRAAGPGQSLAFPQPDGPLNHEASFLARLLGRGGAVYLPLPDTAVPSRSATGAWSPDLLRAAVESDGPLGLAGEVGNAGAKDVALERVEGQAPWLSAKGLPHVVLLENSSTVSPLSKSLGSWGWPVEVKSFESVEADPGGVLDPAKIDLVVFSSPGWWDDFADPPGGPSRMNDKVVRALRNYVHKGGSAVFIDIAQWDLEKAWPHTLSLAPLGPYGVSKLKMESGAKGGLSLAPEGVAPDALHGGNAVTLVGDAAFAYPDGGTRPLHAAYVMPDPGGGRGWIAGLAFHVFDQDESLSTAARRLFLNLLLISGNRRLDTPGQAPVPTPAPTAAPAQPTPVPTDSPTTLPTAVPSPRPAPAPTSTLVPTALPTPAPTVPPAPAPTAVPTFPPTAVPTAVPSPVPTALPTAVPTAAPSPAPTAVPTPIPAPRPVPVPLPTPRPALRPQAPPPPQVSAPPPPVLQAAPPTINALVRPSPTPPPQRLPTAGAPVPPAPAPPTPVFLPTQIWRPAPKPHWPTPTPTPVPRNSRRGARRKRTPTPTPQPAQDAAALLPRPTVVLAAAAAPSLGCLDSAPQPFGEGGVYLSFCLSQEAWVRILVYGDRGKQLWRSPEKGFAAGHQQWYYDGLVNRVPISAGTYVFEVQARYLDGQRESRQGSITRAPKKRT